MLGRGDIIQSIMRPLGQTNSKKRLEELEYSADFYSKEQLLEMYRQTIKITRPSLSPPAALNDTLPDVKARLDLLQNLERAVIDLESRKQVLEEQLSQAQKAELLGNQIQQLKEQKQKAEAEGAETKKRSKQLQQQLKGKIDYSSQILEAQSKAKTLGSELKELQREKAVLEQSTRLYAAQEEANQLPPEDRQEIEEMVRESKASRSRLNEVRRQANAIDRQLIIIAERVCGLQDKLRALKDIRRCNSSQPSPQVSEVPRKKTQLVTLPSIKQPAPIRESEEQLASQLAQLRGLIQQQDGVLRERKLFFSGLVRQLVRPKAKPTPQPASPGKSVIVPPPRQQTEAPDEVVFGVRDTFIDCQQSPFGELTGLTLFYSARGIHGFQNLYGQRKGYLFCGVGNFQQKQLLFSDRSRIKLKVFHQESVEKIELFSGQQQFRVGKEREGCVLDSVFTSARGICFRGGLGQAGPTDQLFLLNFGFRGP